MEKYVSKAELEKAGWRKIGKCIVHLDVISRYAENGDLEMIGSVFDARDKVSAASRLFVDFYLGRLSPVRVTNPGRLKVDGGAAAFAKESVLDRKQSYLQAMRAIPWQFRSAVRTVCIEDKAIKPAGAVVSQSRHKQLQFIDRGKFLLNLGLDCLVRYYLKKISTKD